ncbi:MAG: hypothetical protein IT357_16815 [Gemmatimonadaceae bacterium]|nr:hypothetical protein [Gemmatimonadaceae bacterium]
MRTAAVLVLASILSIVPSLPAQGNIGAEPLRPAVPNGSDPKSWEPYFDLGVKLMKSQPSAAADAFYWATRFDPTRAEPPFARYAAFFVLAKQEDAIAYFRSEPTILRRPDVLAADSLRTLALMRNPFVHRGLEILIFDRMPGNFSDSRDTRAWIAYSNGEFPKAIDLHSATINREGEKALWRRYDRALAYVAANQLPLALADLRALVEALRAQDAKETVVLYRSKHFLLYMIGMILTQQRNYVEARTAFQEAQLEDAAFAYGNAGLAALSRAQRNPTQAAGEYALAVELAPNDGVLRQQYGQVLIDLQRYEGAVEQLQRATTLEPYWALPHLYLGRAREKQGKMDEAFAHYERFVALSTANDSQAKAIKLRLDLRKGSGQ